MCIRDRCLVCGVFVATGLVIASINIGLSGVNKRVDEAVKRIDDVPKRVDDIVLQLSEIRQALWGIVSTKGTDD